LDFGFVRFETSDVNAFICHKLKKSLMHILYPETV